ncbi:MAG: metallophosphoesterase [Myxococcota bacterium]|nr:metallophosphoesterase [Myxococcota bacterium]
MSNGSLPFRLAHLSDLHATSAAPRRASELASKRLLGWLSWMRKRRFEHMGFVLEALIEDLPASGARHVAISGDMTHIGLPSEIAEAARWLARIGPPEAVSLVPGNHDAYAPSATADPWAPWGPYLDSRDAAGLAIGPGVGADRFPTARRLGPVAIVGASSARATLPLLATGRLGDAQRERLASVLRALGDEGAFRVLVVHHPPLPVGQSRRRQLDDAAALRAVLARSGAELVLHGHTHRTSFAEIPGPAGPIPVVGVPSSSSIGTKPERRARYHVYCIDRGADGRFTVSYEVRGFDPATRRFAHEGEGVL